MPHKGFSFGKKKRNAKPCGRHAKATQPVSDSSCQDTVDEPVDDSSLPPDTPAHTNDQTRHQYTGVPNHQSVVRSRAAHQMLKDGKLKSSERFQISMQKMDEKGGNMTTTMPVRFHSMYELNSSSPLEMEEEPMPPLLTTFPSLTFTTLSPTKEEDITHSSLQRTASGSRLGRRRNCHTSRSCHNSQRQASPQEPPGPSAKEVAEEISRQFKHCLPHTHGESDLHRVAFEGDAVQLRSLLESISSDPMKSETINQRNRLGCTPVRLAATGGHYECLSLLIDEGADINIVDVKCQTPLFVSIKNRRFECALKLLQCGANPDGDPGNSSTPLNIAFMNGSVRCVLLLLEHGASPDKLKHLIPGTCSKFYNPMLNSLNAAIEYLGNEDDILLAVKKLIICGCTTKDFDYHSCVSNNYSRVIELLFSFGLGVSKRDSCNRLATEINYDNKARETLRRLRENPRSLMSACRICVLRCQPKPRINLDRLNSLPLPSSIVSYLKFDDV